MQTASICKFPAPAAPAGERAPEAEQHDPLSPVDAPAEINVPGAMAMPCVVGVLSDIAMRLWCTRAVAIELTGGAAFVTPEAFPELTVRSHLPLCKRTITTTAICDVSAARVAGDGGFVLDLRVRHIGVHASEVVRRFRRERGRLDASTLAADADRAGSR